MINLIVKSYREAEAGPRKDFLRRYTVGILLLLLSGPLLGIMLPMLGISSTVFMDLVTVVASMIFYLAINRFHFDTIHELNVGLEQKVLKRTRHLQETQAQLVQSQKMASMGRLVAGIAHEMNNPVSAIQSSQHTLSRAMDRFRDSMEDKYGSGSLAHPELKHPFDAMGSASSVIEEGSERVSSIVGKLKNFVRLDESDLQETNTRKCIEDTIELFSQHLKPGIEIKTQFAELDKVTCYPAKLNQLLLLILDNANRAVEEEGTITVSMKQADGQIRISIADTGVGIPEKNREKVFDPGFTTWGVGVGVGLGLTICYQIAREHHGRIEVESEVGKGSTFTMVFPNDVLSRIKNKSG